MGKFTTKQLTYTAICISLATVLHLLKLFNLPFGGSATFFSMFFVSFIGFLFGPIIGITGGLAFGLLQMIVDPSFYHPVQIILDYPLAFAMLGCSGFFANKRYGLYTGFTVACFMRFLCHCVSGYIFFGSYAPEG